MNQRTVHRPAPAHRPVPPARRKRGTSIVQQRRTPWRMIAAVVTFVAVAVVVTVIVAATSHTKSTTAGGSDEVMPSAVTGAITHEAAPQTVTDTSGIAGVLAWNTTGWPGDGTSPQGALQHAHVAGPVVYTETPPVGGPHNAVWLNAGIYDQPVPSERAVHDLEHGAVWITYTPGLSNDQVQALRNFVLAQSTLREQTPSGSPASRYIVMSPWASTDLPSPIVISSWGHQLRVTSASDPRLQQFIDMFRSSKTYTPEVGEVVDGVPVRIGGRPLAG